MPLTSPAAPRRLRGRVAPVLLALAVAGGVLAGCSDEPSDDTSTSSEQGSESPAVASLVQTGLDQMTAGQDAAAQGTFENVLTLDPENLYALYNLGLLAQRADRSTDALELYDQALAVDGSFAPALYNKAILTETSDLPAAIELYRQAIEADPEFAPAFMRLGFALVHTGETKEGEEHLETGIGLDPTMAEVDAPSYR